MKIALDTNRYSDLARGAQEVRDHLERADAVFLPFVVIAELRCGFVGGRRTSENEQALARFLDQPGAAVLYADNETTGHYASVFHQLRRQGTPIPTNDIWIASLCLQHDLTLYARDAHFDHIVQLRRL
jgi:tRNA(fMet)-specific endonuclease VapC